MNNPELEKLRKKRMQEMLSGKDESISKQQEAILNKPITVTDATFGETIRKYSLIVVDCWAPWCGPCFMIAPILEELAKDYAGKIVFGKLNVDENQRTAMKYGIMSIPALLIFKKGKHVDTVIGAMPRQMLEPQIKKYL